MNHHLLFGITAVACLASANATTVFIDSPTGDFADLQGGGGFARGLTLAPDSSGTFSVVTNAAGGNNDLLYGSPALPITAAERGQMFIFTFEVSTAAVTAGEEFFGSVGYLVRFIGDANDDGQIQFGPGNEFANRVSFENGAAVPLTAAGTGGFIPVTISGTVPLVDGANEDIDLLQFNSVFGGTASNVGGATAQYRNVNFTVVPEPSSALLLGLGGVALLRRRR